MNNDILNLLNGYNCPGEYFGITILEDLLSTLSLSKSIALDYKPAIAEVGAKHRLQRNSIEKNLRTLISKWSEKDKFKELFGNTIPTNQELVTQFCILNRTNQYVHVYSVSYNNGTGYTDNRRINTVNSKFTVFYEDQNSIEITQEEYEASVQIKGIEFNSSGIGTINVSKQSKDNDTLRKCEAGDYIAYLSSITHKYYKTKLLTKIVFDNLYVKVIDNHAISLKTNNALQLVSTDFYVIDYFV
jgi:ribosomal protein L16 Arg81 hydroxylase